MLARTGLPRAKCETRAGSAPFWKPGPGPGLDRTSWFSSKPENMRLWPSAPGSPSREGGRGRVASTAGSRRPAGGARPVLSRCWPWGPGGPSWVSAGLASSPHASEACDGSVGALWLLAPDGGGVCGFRRPRGQGPRLPGLNPEMLSGAGWPQRVTPPSAPLSHL